MSYEEARQDRKRNRKAQRTQMLLGMLAAAGQTIAGIQKQKKDDEYRQQASALKERELGLQERGLEQDMIQSYDRSQTQLDVARINAQGRGTGHVSQWEAEGEGLMDEYGGKDPDEITKLLQTERQQRLTADSMADVSDLDDKAKIVRALMGRRKLQGNRAEPQPTGDLMSEKSVPGQRAMMGPMEPARPPVGPVTARIHYEKWVDAMRRFQASGARDLFALQELNQLYGGTFSMPRSISTQMPGPMMRSATGLGTTTTPR